MADLVDLKSEHRSEIWGYMCRRSGEPRDSNPYAEVPAASVLEKEVVSALAAGWWRGWDEADAVIKARGLG